MGLLCQAQSLGEAATARHGYALALFQPAQCKQEMKGLEFPCGKGTRCARAFSCATASGQAVKGRASNNAGAPSTSCLNQVV